jgi:hypothetical protein
MKSCPFCVTWDGPNFIKDSMRKTRKQRMRLPIKGKGGGRVKEGQHHTKAMFRIYQYDKVFYFLRCYR